MQIFRALPSFQQERDEWRRQGQRIGLVPTMGNLHAGHLALVEAARQQADRVVATIFVNPTQFVAGEDYDQYPRTEAADCEALESAGTDAVFIPDVATMYPAGLAQHTRVIVPGLDAILCGEYRPGHFAGVATVVCKLLNMTAPDAAFFGEKDYQQLLVIRRMVRDLAMGIDIEAVPTRRESDGLALSSRNNYLAAAERRQAVELYQALCEIAAAIEQGERHYARLENAARERLSNTGWQPQYVAVREAGTLAAPGPDSRELRILAAAWLGRARLIDNIGVTAVAKS